MASISVASVQAALLELAARPEFGKFVSALGQLTSTAAVASNPATATAALTVGIAAFCWIGQVTTGYWSFVDRIWSLSPVAYAWIFAFLSGADARLLLITLLISMWGARLTRNFARKGGYGSEEDYRWPILRDWFAANDPLHPIGVQAFSLLFVALYQNVLIWAFVVLPLFGVWANRRAVPLNATDALATAGFLLALYGEHVTDEAQWAFQTAKYAMTAAERVRKGGDYARGFCTTGPFAYSRHLNFVCEQSMWWCVYAFSVAAGMPLVNYTGAGALFLSLLFQGSTAMTEAVTRAKYPAYAAYQRTTSSLIPFLPGPSLDSPEGAVLVKEAMAAGKKTA